MRWLAAVLVFLMTGCAPIVQPHNPNDGAPRLEAGTFITADGMRLPLRVWPAKGKLRAVVVALHGFNDYSKSWTGPAKWWAAHGITTYAYDQRGFGAAPFHGIWPGTGPLAADAREMIRLAAARDPGVPIYLIGESMGAAVAIVALTGPKAPTVSGVVLAAPAVWGAQTMSPIYRSVLWVFAHVMPWNHLTGQALDVRASDNMAALEALGRDPLVIKQTRVDSVYGLVKLMTRAFADSPRLRVPTLVLYGRHDEIIPRKPVRELVDRLTVPHEVAIYPHGWHLLFRDLDRKLVWGDVLAWMENRNAPLPSGFAYAAWPRRLAQR